MTKAMWGRLRWRPLLMVVAGYVGHELLEVLEHEPFDLLGEWLAVKMGVAP